MSPYRNYYLRSEFGRVAALVVQPVEPHKKNKGNMEEDSGHRASLDHDSDDIASLYMSMPSSSTGEISSSSIAEWDATQSNVPASHPVSPFWLADELIESVSVFKAAHSRDFSTASSKTLTNGGSDTDSLAQLNRASSPDNTQRYSILADLLIESAPHLRHLATIRTDDSRLHITSGTPKNQLVTPVEEQRHPGKPAVKTQEPETQEGDEQSQQLPATEGESATANQFLHGIPLLLLTIGLSLVVFLISIDRTIITTVSTSLLPTYKKRRYISESCSRN